MNKNIIFCTDSYKASHWLQYPPNTTAVYSYFESRGGKFKLNLFFGLQYILKEYLEGKVVDQQKIDEADYFYNKHFGNPALFNKAGWEELLKDHCGYLPVRIRAVKEGSIVPNKNVLITVENTDPKYYWLTNYLETLLVQVWYPMTVATQSWYMKQKILDYLELTGTPSDINFKLHDFGFRGVSSVESAGVGGMAHLVNFMGSDTIEGIRYANHYYNCEMAGFSIPASEHSTITSWGKDNELKAYANMLKQYPTGLVACVSDSFNIFEACDKLWGEELRMDVLKRDGVLVIRPDSGYPPEVVCKVLAILADKFGSSVNNKGFRVLNPKVRVIQGDGIDYEMIEEILSKMAANYWSADNIAFGSGGGLLQKLNRDTLKCAFKCSSVDIDGKTFDVFKNPVTDFGKKSKAGRLDLVEVGGGLNIGYSYRTVQALPENNSSLRTVFDNGRIINTQSLDEIRTEVVVNGDLVKKFEGL